MYTKVMTRQNNTVVSRIIAIQVHSMDNNEKAEFLFRSFTYCYSLVYAML